MLQRSYAPGSLQFSTQTVGPVGFPNARAIQAVVEDAQDMGRSSLSPTVQPVLHDDPFVRTSSTVYHPFQISIHFS